jgi:prevent-host-death family protein
MVMNMVMKPRDEVPAQISAAEFKATCLDLLDVVERTGGSVVVTKRGRAVARLAPVRARVRSAFGLLKGRITVRGNIVGAIDVAWDATR